MLRRSPELVPLRISLLVPLVAAFLSTFSCVDAPAADTPPQARVIVVWDPVLCGDPHRVVVELEDDDGAPLRASGPCTLGGLTLDITHFGVWHGRIYSWVAGDMERSILPVTLAIDEPLVRWYVDTPR